MTSDQLEPSAHAPCTQPHDIARRDGGGRLGARRNSAEQPDLGRERVLAAIVRVLSTCFMRPGSQVYASENGSYGVATLRPKHVSVKGDVIEFDFPGKSGVQQERVLKDRQVAKVVRVTESPGKEVFKYQNGNGQFVNVTNRHINEYIKETMGERFSERIFAPGREQYLRLRPRARGNGTR